MNIPLVLFLTVPVALVAWLGLRVDWELGLGLGLFVAGVLWGGFVFICNSSTPLQFGPVPFFVCVALVVIGLVFVAHAPWWH